MQKAIVVYTYRRPDYLKLTMNSILYSLQIDVPVVLVIQDPDIATMALAKEYAARNVNVLYTKDNCKFAGFTVAMNWYRPDKVVMWQDDLIAPAKFRDICQNWISTWDRVTEDYDVATMQIGTSNLPAGARFDQVGNPIRVIGDWSIYELSKGMPLFLCQPFMISQTLWRQAYHSAAKAAVDTRLLNVIKTIAVLNTVECYHLSWNQAMDGYNDRALWSSGFNLDIAKTTVQCLNTGEIREIVL